MKRNEQVAAELAPKFEDFMKTAEALEVQVIVVMAMPTPTQPKLIATRTTPRPDGNELPNMVANCWWALCAYLRSSHERNGGKITAIDRKDLPRE